MVIPLPKKLMYDDPPELIEKCLNCTKPKCINCLGISGSQYILSDDIELRKRCDRLTELHELGYFDSEIARIMGLSKTTVYNCRVALGLEAVTKVRKGKNND